MLAADDILAWGRVDPYYVWAHVAGFANSSGGDWLPLLVEDAGGQGAPRLWDKIRGEFGADVFRPLANGASGCFSMFVRPGDTVARLLQYLGGQAARWELALPHTAADAASAPPSPARPRCPGQVVGFIDYGCAFAHRQFRRAGFSTRVASLWDQSGSMANQAAAGRAGVRPPAWAVPADFGYGVEWHRGVDANGGLGIDAYIAQFAGGTVDEQRCYACSGYAGILRPDTHGTFVMDLATGEPNPLPGASGHSGARPDIVFVELPRLAVQGEPVTWLLRAHVLDAVRYIFSCARDGQPVTINLSYGAYAGPHDGTSILEQALDEAIAARRAAGGPTDLVIAAGNGAASNLHAHRELAAGGNVVWTWRNGPQERTDQFTEVWFDGGGEACKLRVAPPGTDLSAQPWVGAKESFTLLVDGLPAAMLIAPEKVGQSPQRRMVLFAVGPTATLPGRQRAPHGEWKLEVCNGGRAPVTVDAWIERNDPVAGSLEDPRQATFLPAQATACDTLNSLAHGRLPIVVGSCVGGSGRVPDYSGRGRQPAPGDPQPHLNAAGAPAPAWLAVSEESEADEGLAGAAVVGTDQVRRSGTSVACAVATRYVVEQRSAGGAVAQPPVGGRGAWKLPRVP